MPLQRLEVSRYTSVGCKIGNHTTVGDAMFQARTLDSLVKERLKKWPQHPPGVRIREYWLRGRPTEDQLRCHPFLKLPGSARWRTVPDGLWLKFGGTPGDPYVEIFAVEACGTSQNLLDKRARFAPSTHSLLAVCPVEWLMAPVSGGDPTPRWKATGLLYSPPSSPFVVPVRGMHVMYALKRDQYLGFVRHQMPHAHEYIVPIETVTAEDGDKDPALQELLARATSTANFLVLPDEWDDEEEAEIPAQPTAA
jgi:hypothetical protein